MNAQGNDDEFNIEEISNGNDEDNKPINIKEEEEEENYGDFENENYNYEPEKNDLNINSSSQRKSQRKKEDNDNTKTIEAESQFIKKDNHSISLSNNNNNIKNEELLLTKPPQKEQNIKNQCEEKQTQLKTSISKENIIMEKGIENQCLNNNKNVTNNDKSNINSNRPQSNIQMAEATFYVIKTELQNILSQTAFENSSEIGKQNQELLHYLSKLNDILNLLVSSSKIEQKKTSITQCKSNQPKKVINQSVSSSKLVEVYKREYLRLESRLKQLSNEEYENHLNKQLENINSQIAYYESEIKKLKSHQKQSEIIIDKQSKSSSKSRIELRRIEMDYNNIISQQHILSQKIEKHKETLKENEVKIAQLTECQTKLEKIAKEMYNIETFENVQIEENNDKQREERRQMLIRKYEVYEKVIKTNKKKYETEMAKNEKIINQLKEKKNMLLQTINEKSTEVNSYTRDGIYDNQNWKMQIQNNNKKLEEFSYNIYDDINKVITIKEDGHRTKEKVLSQHTSVKEIKKEDDKREMDNDNKTNTVLSDNQLMTPTKEEILNEKQIIIHKDNNDNENTLNKEEKPKEKAIEENIITQAKNDKTIIEQKEYFDNENQSKNNYNVELNQNENKQKQLPSFLDDLKESNSEIQNERKALSDEIQLPLIDNKYISLRNNQPIKDFRQGEFNSQFCKSNNFNQNRIEQDQFDDLDEFSI